MFMGTTPFITVRARRPLTEIEFCAWVAQAVPGAVHWQLEGVAVSYIPFDRKDPCR